MSSGNAFVQDQLPDAHSSQMRKVRWALFSAGFSIFGLLYYVQSLLPEFSEYFAVSPAESSLALSSTTMVMSFALLFSGVVSDSVGRKPIMFWSMLLSSFLTLAMVFAPSWGTVVTIRFLMGVSLCGVQAAAMAYLSEEMPPQAFGKALGLFISGGALGGMFGRVAVSLVTDHFGWREATFLMAVLGIVSSFYFVRTLPQSQNFHPSSPGLKRLARGFAAIMSDTVFLQLFAIGFLMMGSFVTTYNYITYRLIEPPFSLTQSVIGSIFLIYFTGMFGAAWAGNRASIVSHQNMLWKMTAVVILGLLVTLSGRLEFVILGLILFTFGFFSTHSVASGWVSQRAKDDRALAASLYLFAYYQGSALVGTSGGYAWQEGGWPFVVSVTGAVSFFGLLLALNLRRYVEKRQLNT